MSLYCSTVFTRVQCISEVTDIFCVSAFVPVLFHKGPGQDISSQYLHKASETIAIYRPCFCWYSPAVKIISVCTQTPVLLEARKRIQSRHTTHPENEEGRIEFLSLSLSISPLPLFLFSFFSLAVYLSPCLFHSSILHAIQRLSCFPLLPQQQTPIKLGFGWKAVIQNLSAVFLQIIYSIKGKWLWLFSACCVAVVTQCTENTVRHLFLGRKNHLNDTVWDSLLTGRIPFRSRN